MSYVKKLDALMMFCDSRSHAALASEMARVAKNPVLRKEADKAEREARRKIDGLYNELREAVSELDD